MKLNVSKKSEPVYTTEGGKASKISKLQELERTVMSCLLWENEFYEDGVSISDRIKNLIQEVDEKDVIELIKKVKFDMRLRHCPLWMIVCLLKKGSKGLKNLIASVLTRPDDMGELILLYKKLNGDKPLPHSIKDGIALAYEKFDEYQLAKYNRNSEYKLVDIANLCHPKTTTAIDKLIKGTLETPTTWEVGLSKAGKDTSAKANVWNALIAENKLPDMAFLKNIRGMLQVGVTKETVINRIKTINQKKLLPIDFIRAGQNNPEVENEIENKLLNFYDTPTLKGKTAILVDVSGSMYSGWDSDYNRSKYASALAMIGREACEDVDIYTFSSKLATVPNRRGFALVEAINNSQSHSCTYMWQSISQLESKANYDRLIVITDEQTDWCDDKKFTPKTPKTYIINVATNKRGVGYDTNIVHINGTSDRIYNYLEYCEQ